MLASLAIRKTGYRICYGTSREYMPNAVDRLIQGGPLRASNSCHSHIHESLFIGVRFVVGSGCFGIGAFCGLAPTAFFIAGPGGIR